LNNVVVIDYGLCNIYSVTRAFEKCGATVVLANNAKDIASAPRLVLPGVGAFPDGMAGLRQKNLLEPILEFADSGRPIL
jgi:glutamine amidotransferase